MATVDLQFGDHQIRVACPRRIARRLRAALHDHVVDSEAPIGFVVRPTTLRHRKLVLVDRCGFVLATLDRADQVLAALASHLSALLPVRHGHVRLRVRTLISQGRATLCLYPMLFVPELQETQLAEAGYAILDALAVDIDPTDGTIVGCVDQWRGLEGLIPAPGHMSALGADLLPVERVALPAAEETVRPTTAEVVVALSSEALAGRREDVLSAAIAIAATADATSFDVRKNPLARLTN